MKKKMICIICPRSCELVADVNGEEITVTGNVCKRGEAYAKAECTNPLRTLTSFVRVSDRNDIMVSVKSSTGVPKAKLSEIMEIIRKTQVCAPVKEGDVIIENIYGADIIATKTIL